MKNDNELTKSIESEEYFQDSKSWYYTKYLMPFEERSIMAMLVIIVVAFVILLSLSVRHIVPITKKVQYALQENIPLYSTSARIIKADYLHNSTKDSIADIMIKNYVTNREKYNYNKLHSQFVFVNTNSSKGVFKQFEHKMSKDNPSSFINKYQKYAIRYIKILSVQYTQSQHAVVKFQSTAKDISDNVLENTKWQADIDFIIDDINLNAPNNSKFNFLITYYQISQIQ
ncbi:MAG: VirB8/TrbF family protein [Rickettsiaceae bacterium]